MVPRDVHAKRPYAEQKALQDEGLGVAAHRDVEYEITKVENQWMWTIYPNKKLAPRFKAPVSYSTKREAEAACRAAIDRALATHPS